MARGYFVATQHQQKVARKAKGQQRPATRHHDGTVRRWAEVAKVEQWASETERRLPELNAHVARVTGTQTDFEEREAALAMSGDENGLLAWTSNFDDFFHLEALCRPAVLVRS